MEEWMGLGNHPRWGEQNREGDVTMRSENGQKSKTLNTDRDVKNIRQDGTYRITGKPTTGLYLRVLNSGQNKYWFKRYRFHGKRHDISFGSYPTVGLADAVARAMEAERERFGGNDPLEARAEQKRERRRAAEKNKTFKTMADDFIDYQSNRAPKKWKPKTKEAAESIINGHLAPLHKYLCSEITPKQIFNIVDPLRAETPSMADAVLKRARTVFDWAYANDAMDGKANPASMKGPLRILFQTDNIEPEHEPRQSINWRKSPPLMAKLNEISQPRTRYNILEAATTTATTVSTIYNKIGHNLIKASRPESPGGGHNKIEIEPEELFQHLKKVVDVSPGLPPITVFLLKFLILNWSRFDEVRFMEWSEWRREENLWVIPWQRVKGRNKAGYREIRIDHVVPLNYRSVETLNLLDEQRKRDKNESKFVFGHYRSANGSERMGQPPTRETVSKLLRRLLPPEEIKAVLHGMRTTGRSWGNVQRRMGYLKVTESDLERALAHVEGYGETPLIRLYSRDDDEIRPLILIFDSWADFLNSDTQSADVVTPFRRKVKATGG
jgi:integrase